MTSNTTPRRTVVANISLSLDGRVNGPGGEYDMSWIAPHAVTDAARDLMVRLTDTATTILLGRKNYEGFAGFWPPVADDENAEPRDRATARWLNSTEKVVFSTTLTDATWQNSWIAGADPAATVRRLREEPGGDIVIQNSSSLIRALLDAGEVDRMMINLCPELAGGGARLFEDGVPRTSWSLTDLSTSESGAICLVYDRVTN
ncbi:dihydrofolate reductase family protein [Jiangella asiatica]|uniref:Riboflavin biosynthesis protein RibD n=1 Tax=Jiangella asiatica TaxID=2530372 RepID=A0A4R5CN68_9ACTN|nr:dihydrofolate reductase family protein [Jiangella asiatica]TDE00161.1 riboflavin biosynthesis protein RibD [Jiangella asiatica]